MCGRFGELDFAKCLMCGIEKSVCRVSSLEYQGRYPAYSYCGATNKTPSYLEGGISATNSRNGVWAGQEHLMREGCAPRAGLCAGAVLLLYGGQRLIEIGDNIVGVLDAAAQSHQIDAHAGFLELFLGELAMRGACRI